MLTLLFMHHFAKYMFSFLFKLAVVVWNGQCWGKLSHSTWLTWAILKPTSGVQDWM